MLFSLEPLPAKEGDCLLLHWKDAGGTIRLAVIDGGPGTVYEEHLSGRLEDIRVARNLDTLQLDLVMVSHVDNDHIVGVKKLVRDMRREIEKGVAPGERPIAMDRMWHNTFDDVVGNALDAHYKSFTASFTAGADGAPPAQTVSALADAFKTRDGLDDEEAEHEAFDVAKLLAGHGEGRTLRIDHKFLHTAGATQSLNSPFAHTLITAEQTPASKNVAGLFFRIVGPLAAQIEALQAAFDKYLKDHDLHTAQATLAAYADKSVPNLSSIVCIAQIDNKRILLTGDARGDYIIEGLKGVGLLDGAGTIHVDVLKVPHHGSDANVEPEFFKKITADHYVLSGNGKHGNPERHTVEWIIASRAKADDYTLHFTYSIDDTDKLREREIHGSWDDGQDSLAALLKERKVAGHQFTVAAGALAPIDLGDESIDW